MLILFSKTNFHVLWLLFTWLLLSINFLPYNGHIYLKVYQCEYWIPFDLLKVFTSSIIRDKGCLELNPMRCLEINAAWNRRTVPRRNSPQQVSLFPCYRKAVAYSLYLIKEENILITYNQWWNYVSWVIWYVPHTTEKLEFRNKFLNTLTEYSSQFQ